jgi:hypothetical protein
MNLSSILLLAVGWNNFHTEFQPLNLVTPLYVESESISLKFRPPAPARRNPVSTGAGGRRGIERFCTAKDKAPLTAIQPAGLTEKTVSSRPSILVFIPENTSESADLILLDELGNQLINQKYKTPREIGIYKLRMPSNLSLNIDKNYYWRFALICNRNDRTKDDFVTGEIKRIVLSSEEVRGLQNKVNTLEKARLFADYGLWNETVEQLTNDTGGLREEWQDLLRSIGISSLEILQAPVIETLEPL